MSALKNYHISDEYYGYHRDTLYYSLVCRTRNEAIPEIVYREIDGICVVVCKLESDNNWWIVYASPQDETNIDDIGPFTELEDAIMNLYLLSTPHND